METNSSRSVSAVDFVHMNRSKSQSALVEGSDHHQYVVKWMNGARSTICARMEALRNSTYRLMGLPVSTWTTIEIPEMLIDAYPQMRLKSSIGPIRPAAGLHFGSRVVCDPPERSYESVPADWYLRIRNRSDFWGAYALDVWTERYDERQVIFRHCENSNDIQAVFIDHGNSVTSRESNLQSGIAPCLYPDKDVYIEHEMTDEIEEWIARIQHHGLSAIANAYAQLPSDWQTASVEAFAHQIINRMEELPEAIFPSIPRTLGRHHVFAKSATAALQSVRRVA